MVRNILITGGTGYVGGRLALALSSLTNTTATIATRQIPASQLTGVRYLQVQSMAEDVLTEALEGIDTVIHLAALNEIDCVKYPHDAITVNIGHTLRWLDAATSSGVQQFIYFSTIHVYGSPLTGEIDELTMTKPVHPYSITHRAAEDYVLAARQMKGIDGIVLRLSNSFGAPATPNVNRWTLLVNDLCRQAVENQHLVLHSDGSQVRDFIPMSDVIQATKHLIMNGSSLTHDGLFNLSAGQNMRVFDMALLIASRYQQLFGSAISINRLAPTTEAASMRIACDKLESIGVTFTRDFEQAIDETLMFCHRHFVKGL